MNRHANFVGVKIAAVDKADVVGRHDRQTTRLGQLYRRVQVALFVRTAGTDQLQIEAIREVGLVEAHALIHQRRVAAQQAFAHVAHTPAGEQDQPLVHLRQPLPVDPRPQRAVATLVGTGDEQRQVLVAGVVGREHRNLGKLVAHDIALDVKIRPNDWLNPCPVARSVELNQTAEVGKIGDRQCRLTQCGRLFYQRPGLSQPIDHGVVAVHP